METLRAAAPTLALASLLAVAPGLAAQATVEGGLARLDAGNGVAWAAPVARGLVRDLTAAFPGGLATGSGLSFRVGLRGMRAPARNGSQTFTATLPRTATWQGVVYQDPWVPVSGDARGPTAVGSGPGVVLAPRPGSPFAEALAADGRDPGQLRVAFPDGLDLDPVSLVLLEGVLGLGSSTDLAIRLTPTATLVSELGDVTVVGVALSQNLFRRHLGPLRVDLDLGAGVQRLRAGGWLDALATSYTLGAATRLGPLRLRGSAVLSGADVALQWRARNPGDDPGFPVDGSDLRARADMEHRLCASAGASLVRGRLELAADYGAGERGAFALGLFVALR